MVRKIDEEESRIRRLKRRLDDVVSEVRQEGVPNPIRQWQDEAVWSDSWSTSVSVSQLTTRTIDDFEDGDKTVKASNWTGWSGDVGSLQIQQSTSLSGSWSAQLPAQSSQHRVKASRSNPIKPSEVICLMMVDTSQTDGLVSIRLGSNGTRFATAGMEDPDNWDTNFTRTSGSWQADTIYRVRFFNFDFGADEVDIEAVRISDQTTVLSEQAVPFFNSVKNFDEIYLDNDENAGADIDAFFDDIKVVS